MSLNATLWFIFVGHQIGIIFIEVVAKDWFTVVPMTCPMGCSTQTFVYKLLWQGLFFIFIAVPIGKTCQMSLIKFKACVRYFFIKFLFFH